MVDYARHLPPDLLRMHNTFIYGFSDAFPYQVSTYAAQLGVPLSAYTAYVVSRRDAMFSHRTHENERLYLAGEAAQPTRIPWVSTRWWWGRRRELRERRLVRLVSKLRDWRLLVVIPEAEQSALRQLFPDEFRDYEMAKEYRSECQAYLPASRRRADCVVHDSGCQLADLIDRNKELFLACMACAEGFLIPSGAPNVIPFAA